MSKAASDVLSSKLKVHGRIRSTPMTAVSPAGTNGLLSKVTVMRDSTTVFENMNSALTVLRR